MLGEATIHYSLFTIHFYGLVGRVVPPPPLLLLLLLPLLFDDELVDDGLDTVEELFEFVELELVELELVELDLDPGLLNSWLDRVDGGVTG